MFASKSAPHLDRGSPSTRPPALSFERLVGHDGWWRLHPDIQRRFGPGHADVPVDYRGTMLIDRSPIGLAFALFALVLGGPLPLRRASSADAIVRVAPDGHGGVSWERWLRFGVSAPTHIRSVKRAGPDKTLLECVDGGLGMVLFVYEDHGALVFESLGYFLAFGPRRVPIPSFLTPGRCRVAHAAVAEGRFSYDLTMRHPLWGTTFHQCGVFTDPED